MARLSLGDIVVTFMNGISNKIYSVTITLNFMVFRVGIYPEISVDRRKLASSSHSTICFVFLYKIPQLPLFRHTKTRYALRITP